MFGRIKKTISGYIVNGGEEYGASYKICISATW